MFTWLTCVIYSVNIWAKMLYCLPLVCIKRKDFHVSYPKSSLDGDGTGYLKCGAINGTYATVDFGPGANVNQSFSYQRQYAPRGPLINSEFYPGWLDIWGQGHSTVPTGAIVKTLDEMLAIGVNVNFYMFFGGTNFGFTSG